MGVIEVQEPARMTSESFLEFCRLNPDLNFELDKNGNILVMAPVGFDGSINEGLAYEILTTWNNQARPGYVTNSNGGYKLPDGSIKVPDAAWVSRARIDALSKAQRVGFPPLCPDFVIEVRSATDSLGPLQKKMAEYMQNGCRLAFLVDPVDGQAFVYRAGMEAEHITGLEVHLSGEDVLPGFLLDLKLFS